MSSTWLGLEIGKSGLSVASVNLDTAGNNISNADTAGYTRQRVVTSEKASSGSSYVIAQIYNQMSGQGVEATNIEQIRSAYLDAEYRSANSDYNYTEYKAQGYTYLTNLMDELDDDGSLTSSITDFFSALGEYSSSDTTSEEYRTNVQQLAQSLTENFNSLYDELINLWEDQNDSVETTAKTINSLTSQIAALNKQIATSESATGTTDNDLRDQRNLLLDELSGYVNISYSNNSDNSSMVDVSIGGVSVVSGTSSSNIVVTQSDEANSATGECYNVLSVQTGVDSKGNAVYRTLDLDDEITSGELYAHMQLTQGDTEESDGITYYINELNSYVQELAQAVNDAHLKGYTYPDDENGNTSTTGVLFFDVDEKTTTVNGTKYSVSETADGTEVFDDGSDTLQVLNDDGTSSDWTTEMNGTTYSLSLSSDGSHFVGTDSDGNTIDLYQDEDGTFYQLTEATDSDGNVSYTYTDSDGDEQTVTGSALTQAYDYSSVTAGNFSISDAISDSVWNLAFSSEAISGSSDSGNNEALLNMFNVLDNDDLLDHLNSIVAVLSVNSSGNSDALDTNETLVDSIDSQRTSLSGVSIDEETVNLIKYQQMYSACSRMITTYDDMLSQLINNTGRVGL